MAHFPLNIVFMPFWYVNYTKLSVTNHDFAKPANYSQLWPISHLCQYTYRAKLANPIPIQHSNSRLITLVHYSCKC